MARRLQLPNIYAALGRILQLFRNVRTINFLEVRSTFEFRGKKLNSLPVKEFRHCETFEDRGWDRYYDS